VEDGVSMCRTSPHLRHLPGLQPSRSPSFIMSATIEEKSGHVQIPPAPASVAQHDDHNLFELDAEDASDDEDKYQHGLRLAIVLFAVALGVFLVIVLSSPFTFCTPSSYLRRWPWI
jgi:hypothetical protein